MTTSSMPHIDLNPNDWSEVKRVLDAYVPEYDVWVFGSRATWTAKAYSDLDLAIITDTRLPLTTIADLKTAFDESDLSLKVDIVDWAVTSETFRQVIKKTAVVVQTGMKNRVSDNAKWRQITLGDVLLFSNGKTSPERMDGGVNPVYGSNGIIGYADETNAEPDAIVIGRVGTYCGSLYLSKNKCWVTDNAIKASAKKGNDARFLYYLLTTLDLNYWRAGSGQPLLNQTILSAIPTSIPDLETQKIIAHILGTLDDKIELNRRMNETLEAMARALFKSWFVDFEPVRAKAEGRDTGLPKEIADLFPDSFEDSELGEVPKGWRVASLGDVACNISRPFNFRQVTDVVFINTGDVLEGEFLHSNRSSHKGLPGQAKKAIQPDDILFSEIRPANKRYAYVDFNASDYVVSTKFMVIKASSEILPRLLYRILIRDETLSEFQVQAESRSGTFPQITFDSIGYLPITLPPMKVQEEFQCAVRDIDARIKLNNDESRTLAALRDALLPKLLSGEIKTDCMAKSVGL